MKVKILIAFFFLAAINAFSQGKYAEIGVGLNNNSFSPVLGLSKDFAFGKKNRIIVGTGIRYTGFIGKEVLFTSAPASIAIDPAKTDTLSAPSPDIHALNVIINLGYKLGSKAQVGFNIDVAGISFGPEGEPIYIGNRSRTPVKAKPTSTNVLLVGNNDRGSLNSQFYFSYGFSKKIGLKLAYQFLFNELTTATKIQTSPEANDRFRLKSSQLYAGLQIKF